MRRGVSHSLRSSTVAAMPDASGRRLSLQFNAASQVDPPPGDFPHAHARPEPPGRSCVCDRGCIANSAKCREKCRQVCARALRSDAAVRALWPVPTGPCGPLGLPQCCSICLFIPDSRATAKFVQVHQLHGDLGTDFWTSALTSALFPCFSFSFLCICFCFPFLFFSYSSHLFLHFPCSVPFNSCFLFISPVCFLLLFFSCVFPFPFFPFSFFLFIVFFSLPTTLILV